MSRTRTRRRRPAVIAAATLAVVGIFAASAIAFGTSSGKAQVSMSNATDITPVSTMSTAWVNLDPPIKLTLRSAQLVNARFTAESACTQKAAICRVRIIAEAPGGNIELDPADGPGFAFDESTGSGSSDDRAEGHAMERSRRLPAGQYRLRVQYSVSVGSTKFTLDDWHFAVEVSE